MRRRLRGLKDKGYVEVRGSRLLLKPKGRKSFKVVFIGGTFEVIHPGHIYTIEQAKRLGDILVAVVARDATVRRRKGRDPIVSEEERRKGLAAGGDIRAGAVWGGGDKYHTPERGRAENVALRYEPDYPEAGIAREAG